MPRMPDFTDVPRSGRANTGSVPRAPREFISDAVGRAGETLLKIEAADKDAENRQLQVNENVAAGRLKVKRQEKDEQDSLELAAARADWNKRRLNEENLYQFESNPKVDDWEPSYGKNIGKHKAASAALISDPKLRQRFEMEADVDATEGTIRVRNRVLGIASDTRRAKGLQSIDDNLQLALTPGLPPKEVDKLFADARRNIDNMVMSGVLTPEQAIEQRKRFTERYANAKVKMDLQQDPEGTYRRLQGGAAGEVYYSKLSSKESGGSDTASPGTSSALGRYQFTEGTWADVMQAHPELGLTKDGRTNRAQQERAIRAFTSDNAKTLESAGIDASEANLYLAHFLGAGGAIQALKAPPGTIAAELMPDAAKANPTIFFAGKGDSTRPRTIAEVIALQTKGFSGSDGPAPDYYQFIQPEERASYSAAAEAEYASRVKVQRDTMALEKYQLKTAMADDIAQIRETGKASDIDPQTIINTLGPDDAAKWIDDRKAAARTFNAVTAMDSMSNDDIEIHLQSLEPAAGDPDFATAQKTYDAAERKAEKLRSLRLSDPAKSVDASPVVREALKSLDPEDPKSVQAVAAARLAAQEQVGIPKAMRQPITRSEAKQIIAPIERIIDMTDAQIVAATGASGGDRAARRASIKEVNRQAEEQIRATVDAIETAYGPLADDVLAFAIAESVRDKEIGNLATRVFKKIAAGERVTISETSGLEAAKDANVADRGMQGTLPKPQNSPETGLPGAGSNPPSQPEKPNPAPGNSPGAERRQNAKQQQSQKPRRPTAREGKPWPSQKDVTTLLKNPGMAAQFDRLYGQGAAAEWLPKE